MPILTPKERLGTKIAGKYELNAIIGEGGMGTVFVARHIWTEREVAVKLLRPQYAQEEAVVRRFLQEARAASKLEHPSVVDVLDMGVDEERCVYQVLELLRGESLSKRIRRELLTVEEMVRFMEPVLDALQLAHDAGIVHRDLKPDNLFLAEERRRGSVLKILDFGIAKMLDGSGAGQTETGVVMGTPYFMAPEQIMGAKSLGSPADVWAIAVVIYQSLTGKRPHEAANMHAAYAAIVGQPARSLKEAGPNLPDEICDWIDRCLSKDPEARPSMRELRQGLMDAMGWELDEDLLRLSLSGESSSISNGTVPAIAPTLELKEGQGQNALPDTAPPSSPGPSLRSVPDTQPLDATIATPPPQLGATTTLAGERVHPGRKRLGLGLLAAGLAVVISAGSALALMGGDATAEEHAASASVPDPNLSTEEPPSTEPPSTPPEEAPAPVVPEEPENEPAASTSEAESQLAIEVADRPSETTGASVPSPDEPNAAQGAGRRAAATRRRSGLRSDPTASDRNTRANSTPAPQHRDPSSSEDHRAEGRPPSPSSERGLLFDPDGK